MAAIGIVHTAFGAVALLCDLAVVLRPKGTRWHRAVGWAYVASMTGLFATAFLIYRLFGRFGPFHWAAVGGAATLAAGLIPVLLRRPRGSWLERHYYLMSYSYLGLLAATGAEIATRVPGGRVHGGHGRRLARGRDRRRGGHPPDGPRRRGRGAPPRRRRLTRGGRSAG